MGPTQSIEYGHGVTIPATSQSILTAVETNHVEQAARAVSATGTRGERASGTEDGFNLDVVHKYIQS